MTVIIPLRARVCPDPADEIANHSRPVIPTYDRAHARAWLARARRRCNADQCWRCGRGYLQVSHTDQGLSQWVLHTDPFHGTERIIGQSCCKATASTFDAIVTAHRHLLR